MTPQQFSGTRRKPPTPSKQPVVRIVRKQKFAPSYGGRWATKYWFHLMASNGRIICHAEQYNRKASRDAAIALLLRGKLVEA